MKCERAIAISFCFNVIKTMAAGRWCRERERGRENAERLESLQRTWTNQTVCEKFLLLLLVYFSFLLLFFSSSYKWVKFKGKNQMFSHYVYGISLKGAQRYTARRCGGVFWTDVLLFCVFLFCWWLWGRGVRAGTNGTGPGTMQWISI